MKIIIASGPVIVENNQVLLDKHGEDPFWKFCGGRVEDMDHSLFEHAQREVQEEMGLEIELSNPTPFIMHITKQTPAGAMDVLLVHFLAKRLNEITPGADIREWRWIPLTELAALEKAGELAPNILPTLQHFKLI